MVYFSERERAHSARERMALRNMKCGSSRGNGPAGGVGMECGGMETIKVISSGVLFAVPSHFSASCKGLPVYTQRRPGG